MPRIADKLEKARDFPVHRAECSIYEMVINQGRPGHLESTSGSRVLSNGANPMGLAS